MKETKVVLYPATGVGHLRPMVELAKLFVSRDVSVTIAVINPESPQSSNTLEFVQKVSSTNPKISFEFLPPPSNPPKPHHEPFVNMIDTLHSYTPQLESFLKSQSEISFISALIFDFFCIDAFDISIQLGIPGYKFYTSGASDLAAFLQVPAHISTINGTSKDTLETPLVLAGVPPLRASDFPKQLQNENLDPYKVLYPILERLPEAKGVLVNTFESLEPRAVQALRSGHCLRNRITPPIYCIGPLFTDNGEEEKEKHPCLTWLDSQPKQSVIFFCFGSLGTFSLEQFQQIAIGLENSGQRFLWVVRNPPSIQSPDPNLDEILPKGFLDRTKDRGMVVKLWAPQVEVLRHVSVGAFVSHCGWNSTIEAVTCGVPIICWPLYAEQRLNKAFLVEEAKIGVELKGIDEELVMADELEEKMRWLMESEGGLEMRNRILVHKESALAAWKQGGSSEEDFTNFLRNLKI